MFVTQSSEARSRPLVRRRIGLGLLMALALVVSLPQASQAAPAKYEIDESHMTIGFLVTHIGFAKTFGLFREASGSFVFDEEALTLEDVKVVVETDSVWSNHDKRDDHLRGSDFLDTDKFPEMTFVGTKAEKTGERTGKITGDLTLLGQTHPLVLDVTWNKSGTYPFGDKHYAIGISARGTLKRSLYGMTYAVAGDIVGDEVELIIEIEGIRQ